MKHIANYLVRTEIAEKALTAGFQKIKNEHALETDVVEMCEKFIQWSNRHLEATRKLLPQFQEVPVTESAEHPNSLLENLQIGSFGLLQDLHAISILIHDAQMCWVVLLQGSKALRNIEMETICLECEADCKAEATWLSTKMKNAAPQALVVA